MFYPVLRQKMRDYGVTNRDIALVLGTNRVVVLLKLWGIKKWTLSDAISLCGFFRYPYAEHLFVRNYNKQQFLESQGENYHV